ncbi:hypothetical protein Tco_1509733 [Tanacetum coccineum]
MLNHSKAKPMGVVKDVLCQVGVTTIIAKFLILDMPIDRDPPILVGRGFLYTCRSILNTRDRITSTFDRFYHQTFCAAKTSLNTEKSDIDNEEDYSIQRNNFGAQMYGPKPAKYLNYWNILNTLGCDNTIKDMLEVRVNKMGSDEVLNGLSAPTYYRTLDANILRELICFNGRLISKEIAPSIPRVVRPRVPRPTTSDLYDKISQLET